MQKMDAVCPECGSVMPQIHEFFEGGYKNCFSCGSCGIGDKKYWFDSYCRETIPHETWAKRHERVSMLYRLLMDTRNDGEKKKIKKELKEIGDGYE